MCIGYYKNPAAYRKAMYKGFFLTGDLAYEDTRGYYHFADRKKDLIIRGGLNILPGEIDEVLFRHPAVLEASTIGVPDKFFGENIVSFIVPKKPVTEEVLIAHCAKYLQYVKRPSRIIFQTVIPKTPSGKLLRRKLRTLYDETYKQQ